jgi:hypothetical protein
MRFVPRPLQTTTKSPSLPEEKPTHQENEEHRQQRDQEHHPPGQERRQEGAPQSSPSGLAARSISASRTMAPRGSSGAVSRIEVSTAAKGTRPCARRARRSISARMIDPWAPCWDTPGRPSFPLTAVSGSPDTLLYPREAASREPWHSEGGRARPREANSYHRGPACLSR